MKIILAEKVNGMEATLSTKSDGELFVAIANAITNKFSVSWTRKLDGLDQRYWDFKLNECELTLHLEHYLGISLFPTSKTTNQIMANELVKKIADYFSSISFDEEVS